LASLALAWTLLVISTMMQYEMQVRRIDQGSITGALMPGMNTPRLSVIIRIANKSLVHFDVLIKSCSIISHTSVMSLSF
jgi:hypothetical protein